jgi:hypothetical protein
MYILSIVGLADFMKHLTIIMQAVADWHNWGKQTWGGFNSVVIRGGWRLHGHTPAGLLFTIWTLSLLPMRDTYSVVYFEYRADSISKFSN